MTWGLSVVGRLLGVHAPDAGNFLQYLWISAEPRGVRPTLPLLTHDLPAFCGPLQASELAVSGLVVNRNFVPDRRSRAGSGALDHRGVRVNSHGGGYDSLSTVANSSMVGAFCQVGMLSGMMIHGCLRDVQMWETKVSWSL